eukprot:403363591
MLSKYIFSNAFKQTAAHTQLINASQRTYQKNLSYDSLSENVKKAEYAVRGKIPQRGEEIQAAINKGQKFPFEKTTSLNIGNPQAVGQGHITFNREVLAALIHPPLQNSNDISLDARERAKKYSKLLVTPLGAYTGNSKGYNYARDKIAEYIGKRDNVEANPNNIYITNGASEGVRTAFTMLIRDSNDGIMIPIPQYPLYSALITLNGGKQINYYLDESKNWGLDANDVRQQIVKAKKDGINIRSIVIINPGNPTGQVLSKENIAEIINICYENNILIMADEVYQNNVYKEGIKFHSFRKVLAEQPPQVRDNVELLSMNSISKGLLGECGLRGGWLEAHNLENRVNDELYKLKSIELCSNTVGQVATLLSVDPPTRGVESDATVQKYEQEKNEIFKGLRERAELLSKTFNEMKNVTCSEIQGAMYAMPRIHLSQSAIEAAKKQGVQPDFLYCMELVDQTGIMTVPGSGFGQRDGEYHLRITNLVTPTEKMKAVLNDFKAFNEKFHDKYK